MLLKRMQPYWRNILKNKKIFMGNYYICKIFAMILIVLIVFTGCGQNRIMEKEEKKETVESEMNEEVKKTAQTFRSVYMKEKSELNTLKVKRKIIICITKISTFLILCDLAVCLATLYVSFSLVFALMRYLQGKVFLIRFYSPTTLSSSRAEFRLPSRLACA